MPAIITFFRFAVGVFFLLLLKLVKRQPFPEDYRRLCSRNGRWILFGAAAKWLGYLTENYALTHGPSYGNIITQPAQTVFLTLISIALFHEKLSLRKAAVHSPLRSGGGSAFPGTAGLWMCFSGKNFLLTLLFIASGTLAGCHVLSQKMVTRTMDMVDGNLTIFSVAAVLSSLPLLPGAASGELAGVHPDLPCILAILLFGFITGIGPLSEQQSDSAGTLLHGAHYPEHHDDFRNPVGNPVLS